MSETINLIGWCMVLVTAGVGLLINDRRWFVAPLAVALTVLVLTAVHAR